MTREPGKRIVSKAKYAFQVLKKYGLGFGSLSIAGAGTILLMVGGFCLFLFLLFLPGKHDPTDYDDFDYLLLLKSGIVGTVGGAACLCAAFYGLKRLGKLRVDVPLTRANTADLPAVDSLVRASEEPLQAQQTVLLRAATETTQGQEAELLRASAGK